MATSASLHCSMAALRHGGCDVARQLGICLACTNARRENFVLPGQEREVPMIPRERCTYSAIVDRPPLKLPDRARLVIWTIVNLEFWSISRQMARQVLPAPTGEVFVPDVPNWSWHEY